MRERTYRILADGCWRSNNTWETGLNNNDLIIGPSGAGKTRGYVKPNLLQCSESVIVADTKGSLIDEVGPALRKRGYEVINVDFTNMVGSYGYNPLDYIRYDPMAQKYREQDIMSIAACLVPVENGKDPFWDYAAAMYLASFIGYVLECLPEGSTPWNMPPSCCRRCTPNGQISSSKSWGSRTPTALPTRSTKCSSAPLGQRKCMPAFWGSWRRSWTP